MVKHIIFDVDGTLYKKDIEYNPKTGPIQTAHDFFRYGAHVMLTDRMEPREISDTLIENYKQSIHDGNLKEKVESIDPTIKEGWDALVKEYGANGKVFDFHHGLTEIGINNFLHEMLAHIDFKATLDKDKELLKTFDYLKSKGYDMGFLTSEVFSTIEDVASAMGFELSDFYIGDDPNHPELAGPDDNHYPIICRDNCIAKPDHDGFEKVMRILGAEPDSLVYVGDSMVKDVIPPLECGWQAIHVLGGPTESSIVKIGDAKRTYTKIGNIYALRDIL